MTKLNITLDISKLGTTVDEFLKTEEFNFPPLLFKRLREEIAVGIQEALERDTKSSSSNPDPRAVPHYSNFWDVEDYYDPSDERSHFKIKNTQGYIPTQSFLKQRNKQFVTTPFYSGNTAHYQYFGNQPESGEAIRPRTDTQFPAKVLKFFAGGEWRYRKTIEPIGTSAQNEFRMKINNIVQEAIRSSTIKFIQTEEGL